MVDRGQQEGQREDQAKSVKCQDPSIDGKVLDNVTGKKLVDTVKHVCLKP